MNGPDLTLKFSLIAQALAIDGNKTGPCYLLNGNTWWVDFVVPWQTNMQNDRD